MIVQFNATAFTMSNTRSSDHEIMQLPETVGILRVHQTSQRNWVIIKVHYRYLRKCLLSWHGSRLGFVTPTIGEVSLGPLGNAHHRSLASTVTKELVARWCITERVKRLAGNEIELGIGYRRSNLGQVTYRRTKGTTYVDIWGSPIKIFVEYVGTNMGIQVPLLVIDRRVVSVMSTSFPNP
jgi:hypothetical protein